MTQLSAKCEEFKLKPWKHRHLNSMPVIPNCLDADALVNHVYIIWVIFTDRTVKKFKWYNAYKTIEVVYNCSTHCSDYYRHERCILRYEGSKIDIMEILRSEEGAE